jgi:hypothetical protein
MEFREGGKDILELAYRARLKLPLKALRTVALEFGGPRQGRFRCHNKQQPMLLGGKPSLMD